MNKKNEIEFIFFNNEKKRNLKQKVQVGHRIVRVYLRK